MKYHNTGRGLNAALAGMRPQALGLFRAGSTLCCACLAALVILLTAGPGPAPVRTALTCARGVEYILMAELAVIAGSALLDTQLRRG